MIAGVAQRNQLSHRLHSKSCLVTGACFLEAISRYRVNRVSRNLLIVLTPPQHHVLHLCCSPSHLMWSPAGQEWHGRTPNRALPDACHWSQSQPETLTFEDESSTESVTAPDVEHLQVPAMKAEGAQHSVLHLRPRLWSLEKISFFSTAGTLLGVSSHFFSGTKELWGCNELVAVTTEALRSGMETPASHQHC